jgi:predicted RNase H-like HicB family nuclease
MQYSILIEAITDPDFPPGYYYAHIPALDLTTHGLGIDGAKAAARELLTAWVEERKARGEPIPREMDSYFAHVELDDALVGT